MFWQFKNISAIFISKGGYCLETHSLEAWEESESYCVCLVPKMKLFFLVLASLFLIGIDHTVN